MDRFIDYLVQPAAQRTPPHLYAKDVPCPPLWRSLLETMIPPKLQYLGPDDLMGKMTMQTWYSKCSFHTDIAYLPSELQAENLMYYLGAEGTL
jgi:hypothetical protein